MSRPATLIALSLLACPVAVRGQSPALVAPTEARTPDEERKAFHLPPGFEAQLVAEEPAINKPMNLAFDDRGRLWVTTTVEYPYPAKEGTKPRDRVVVLDDFAPDGKARKVTTFADGLNIPIGVLPLGRRRLGARPLASPRSAAGPTPTATARPISPRRCTPRTDSKTPTA